jgi:large repetitive protein
MNKTSLKVFKSALCLLLWLVSTAMEASQYSDVVISDHPIAYWKLDQTTDGIAIDEIAGNNGTFMGSVRGYSTKVYKDDGRSVFLTGTRYDYIELPDTGLLDQQTFSLEFWVAEWNCAPLFVNLPTGAYSENRGIVIREPKRYSSCTKPTIEWGSGGELQSIVVDNIPSSRTLRHLVVTFSHTPNAPESQNAVRYYLDGALISETIGISSGISYENASEGSPEGMIRIGGVGGNLYGTQREDYFRGYMDEIAFYDYALTPEQVQHHFIAGVYDTAAPRVASVRPRFDGDGALYDLLISFNHYDIDYDSFTQEDIAITGPDGERVPFVHSRTIVEFDQNLSPGTYQITIGPDIVGMNGLPMDQDQDGIYGEPGDDVYTGSFTVTPPYPVRVMNAHPWVEDDQLVHVILLNFYTTVDMSTFTQDDIRLNGPDGALLTPDRITAGYFSSDAFNIGLEFDQPLAVGSYQLQVGPDIMTRSGTGMDQDEDGIQGEIPDDIFIDTLVVDPPTPPVTPPSDLNYQLLPQINFTSISPVTLQGNRADEVSIRSNGAEAVAAGSGVWSITLNLEEGENNFVLEAVNAAGELSEPLSLRFIYDTVAPVIIAHAPSADGYYNQATTILSVSFDESGSGIDPDRSTLNVICDGAPVTGHWSEADGRLQFIPDQALLDGSYQVTAQLQDRAGLLSDSLSYAFTLDTVAPSVPVINDLPTVTGSARITVSGTKEAGSGIWLDGDLLVSRDDRVDWIANVPLQAGDNTLTFTAQDQAGNRSDPVVVEIRYEDVAPGPVTLGVSDLQDGQSLRLDWHDYDEAANGDDIAEYAVYIETTAYTSVVDLTPAASLSPGARHYIAQGLIANQTYYLGVVAVDAQGNRLQTLTPVMATPTTGSVVTEPLGEIRGLRTVSSDTSLQITWTPPSGPVSRLSGYRVYFSDESGIPLDAGATSYARDGLSPATGYPVRITTLDTQGVESPGVSLTGVTLLSNPGGLSGESGESRVALSWNSASPPQLVKQVAVYVASTDFTSVAGMSPRLKLGASATRATISGLENDIPYYFAVTAVNLSGGETQTVSTLRVTPQADSEGPVIGAMSYRGSPLVDGATLSESGNLTLAVSDETGVSRVEFQLDGVSLGADINGADGFEVGLNLAGLTDGSHTLTMVAYDVLENVTTRSITFSISLALPTAPVITSPLDGHITNQTNVTVTGTSSEQTEVTLRLNGTQVAGPLTLDAGLRFQTQVALTEGENILTAVAQNRSGNSPISTPVSIRLDTQVPDAPLGLSALSQEEGQVLLTWHPSSDERVANYTIYRAAEPFETIAQAQRVNTNPVTSNRYTDLPPAEGTYYYRVAAENELGTSSLLSNSANIEVDTVSPRALAIRYTPAGEYDPVSGRMAAGRVALELEVSEPLLTTPFLSITPSGGVPISIDLSADGDTLYRGYFDIGEQTPSGTAYAVFSARDRVGNRGSEIDEGASILIDTSGPAITELQVTPGSPIHNDPADPVNIQVSFTLDQPPMSGTTPELAYQLSAPGRSVTPIDNLTRMDELHWQGSFTLPADAGLTDAEMLEFQLSARDDLNTQGSEIRADNRYQVYQGDLPPLEIPRHLSAVAQPGGGVFLQWDAVQDAVAYQVYRQGPGEAMLTELQRVATTELSESALTDGEYRYSVASIRQANDQESVSGQSETVSVTADSQAPVAPGNLTLELVGAGIQALWQASVAEPEVLSYRIYRASGSELNDVSGMTPLQSDIVPNRQGILGYLDKTPDVNASVYVVTAVDEAGNESAPSPSAYLNVALLPVATLQVRQTDGGYPELSWSHGGETISGYNLYLDDDATPLNTTPLTGTSYTDQAYGNTPRTYTVTALDTNGVESLGRSVTLAPLLTILPDESVLHRGVMNHLIYSVVNPTKSPVSALSLSVELDGHGHQSAQFDLAAGERRDVAVTVGGYETLPDRVDMQTTLIMEPDTGERVAWTQTDQIPVLESRLTLRLETRAFTRGATGEMRFLLENTSEVETEILTARNQEDSPEIRVLLQDTDGNVVTTAPFRQLLGDGVTTLGSGDTLARIPAGGIYTSPWFELPVPQGAPDQVRVVLQIDRFHYHSGQPEQVDIRGLQSSQAVSLIEAPYEVTLTTVTPQSSYGDEPIVFQGQSLATDSATPMASVPVELVLSVNGFERKLHTVTDAQGAYEYEYLPGANEGGIYTVSAIYPGGLSRPGQGQFILNRYTITPTHLTLRLAKNYRETIDLIQVGLGEGMGATNLRLVYDALDQPTGQLPQGINLVPAEPLALGSEQSAVLAFEIEADNSADPMGSLVLRVVSDESVDQPLSMVTVDYELTEAAPALYFTPNYVETGVTQDASVTETLTLENRGLAALTGVNLTLLSTNGTPAPDWVYLMSPRDQGDLAIGEQRRIQLAASPTYRIPDGIYPFKLRVESANHPTTDINVFVAVTQSGIGQVVFKASDIYTATLDENGDPIPGVAGARIRLQHEEVLSIEQTGTTDENGELLLSDLPAGRYRFRASAPNHQDVSGRLTIKPGITVAQDVFLDFDLITVEWSVTEITIEDKYEIILRATFETDVPAAVVVLEPSSTLLPDMAVGDVFNGELRLTNYGLIRADGLSFEPPGEDGYFRYEFLANLPESLGAKESLVIPYRVTALAPYEPDASGSGGGCGGYGAGSSVNYWYKCANDVITQGSTSHSWMGKAAGSCGSGSGSVSGGSGGGDGGGWGSGGPSYGSLPGATCVPDTEPCNDVCCNQNGPAGSGHGGY